MQEQAFADEGADAGMTGADPLVSIVTPVFNGARYLRETMECVQAQTYGNILHVILDNASTDETPDILASYKSARAPVAVTRNAELLPLLDNWNAAVALIPPQTRYLRILCADDLMAPDAIEKMVGVAERNPSVGLVGSRHHFFRGDHKFTANERPERLNHDARRRWAGTEPDGWPRNSEIVPGRQALAHVLLGIGTLIATHTLMRRSEVERPLFKKGLVAFDTQACLRLLTRCDFGFVREDLALSRVHEESVTSALIAPSQTRYFEWLSLLREFGADAFGEDARGKIFKRYMRQYYCRLLRWRFGGEAGAYAWHEAALREAGHAPSLIDYTDAALDWLACKARLRTRWVGYPF